MTEGGNKMPRLSVEQVKKAMSINICSDRYYTYSGKTILNFFDTIEAQNDEIESLKNWNACEEEQYKRLLESDKRRIELEEEIESLTERRGQSETI